MNRTSGSAPDWPGFYNYAAARLPRQAVHAQPSGASGTPAATRSTWPSCIDSVGKQMSLFPRIKAMVYFDTPADQRGRDSRVDRTAEGLAAYRRLGLDQNFQVDLTGP